ncbi:hypothetical protein BDF14DRAFT_1883324 [Spinellus fusiger]|nr:hypothetical protein BDF14DRAFT_1883324 [Spinellus fusiger]
MHNPRPGDGVSIANTVSSLGTLRSTGAFSSIDHLDQIFQQAREQIERWGENAKWKIDLVLLDQPQSKPASPLPYTMHSLVTHSAWRERDPQNGSHLESVGQSQCNHVSQQPLLGEDNSVPPSLRENNSVQQEDVLQTKDKEKTLETMLNVHRMKENELRVRNELEIKMMQREINALSKKLKRIGSILRTVEHMELLPEDTAMDKKALLEERRLMLRKLHLTELRLTARDAELEYLHETLRTYHESPVSRHSPTLQKQFNKGPPYLFQQQYSPKMRSEIRPTSQPSPFMSGLDSLGILADQMLSNPDFESNETAIHEKYSQSLSDKTPTHTSTSSFVAWKIPNNTYMDNKRSKRSIDSANTLVSMPSLVIPRQIDEEIGDPMTQRNTPPQIPLQATESPLANKKARIEISHWTPSEDIALRKAVDTFGSNQWEKIATLLPTKTLHQCRQRWCGLYLHPTSEDTVGSETSVANKSLDARHSPSIAALLDSNEDMQMREKPLYIYSPATSAILPSSIHASSPLSHVSDHSQTSATGEALNLKGEPAHSTPLHTTTNTSNSTNTSTSTSTMAYLPFSRGDKRRMAVHHHTEGYFSPPTPTTKEFTWSSKT